jgi:hypothetical protein
MRTFDETMSRPIGKNVLQGMRLKLGQVREKEIKHPL